MNEDLETIITIINTLDYIMENNIMYNQYELYIIYMPRVAAALRDMGFKLVKVTANNKKPQYDVYWFENTPELRAAIPIAAQSTKK